MAMCLEPGVLLWIDFDPLLLFLYLLSKVFTRSSNLLFHCCGLFCLTSTSFMLLLHISRYNLPTTLAYTATGVSFAPPSLQHNILLLGGQGLLEETFWAATNPIRRTSNAHLQSFHLDSFLPSGMVCLLDQDHLFRVLAIQPLICD